MTGVMVAGISLESSWLDRQGRGYDCSNYVESSWLGIQGRVFVAGFMLFHTRIKGLTSLVNKA